MLKILCILQNAWGDRILPVTFIPNPINKSAKVIKKMVGDNQYWFSNTTDVVTGTAAGKPKPNMQHFQKVIQQIPNFDVVLVCGKQAKETVESCFDEIKAFGKPVLFVPHPAAKDLTNSRCEEIRKQIDKITTKRPMRFVGLEIGDKVTWEIGKRQAEAKGIVYDNEFNKDNGFWGITVLCVNLHGQKSKFKTTVHPKNLTKVFEEIM
jgi:hypothetical protein